MESSRTSWGRPSRLRHAFAGVGGDRYRQRLLARLGDAGLAEAENESAYFFADELPAVGAWQFGEAEAARVTAPALLVNGSESRPWFAENMERLGQWLPVASPVTLEGCDHLAPLTHPAELSRVTATFVQRQLALGDRSR